MQEEVEGGVRSKRDGGNYGFDSRSPMSSTHSLTPGPKEESIELGPVATYITAGAAAGLSQEHRDYLLLRHGTLDLDPIPSMDPADPYNWPQWKKVLNLLLVSFHACMTTFIAAAIIPAYADISEDLGVSIQRVSYLTSLQIALLGFSPLFWKPISHRYGRRPVWLISTIGALVFNVACAKSESYAAMATFRAFTTFFISPPIAIGTGVVAETFFKKERGNFIGIWTLMTTLGPPCAPFFMGFVAYQTGNYRWIYWILAIVNGVQFIAYIFFGPETRYIRQGVTHATTAFRQQYISFRRIDPHPLKLYEFIEPLALFRFPSVLIPTIAYSVVFGFCSVLLTVEIPQIFIPKFELNSQQIGLQFIGVIIGSFIGEQLGGRLSDYWMNRRARKLRYMPPPEYRLWLCYGGFLLAMVGILVFGVRTQQARHGHWNVTPIIGAGIAAAGNQIVTTVCTTYAVDTQSEHHSASVGAFINLVRSTWGFIGPFWFPDMWNTLGGSGSGGLMAGLIFVGSWIPVAAQQFWISKLG